MPIWEYGRLVQKRREQYVYDFDRTPEQILEARTRITRRSKLSGPCHGALEKSEEWPKGRHVIEVEDHADCCTQCRTCVQRSFDWLDYPQRLQKNDDSWVFQYQLSATAREAERRQFQVEQDALQHPNCCTIPPNGTERGEVTVAREEFLAPDDPRSKAYIIETDFLGPSANQKFTPVIQEYIRAGEDRERSPLGNSDDKFVYAVSESLEDLADTAAAGALNHLGTKGWEVTSIETQKTISGGGEDSDEPEVTIWLSRTFWLRRTP